MTVGRRRLLAWTVVLAACVAVAAFSLLRIIKTPGFHAWLQTELTQRSGYDVRFSDLGFEFPWKFVAGALEISRSGQFHLTANRLAVTITPVDFFTGTIRRIELDKPWLELDLQAWSKASPGDAPQFAVRSLSIRDGVLAVKSGPEPIFELPDLHLNADHMDLDEISGIRLRAGVPALKGEAELQLQGRLRELDLRLIVRARNTRAALPFAAAAADGAEMLHVTAQFQMPENQPASLVLAGQFQELPARGVRMTGSLHGTAEIDQKLSSAQFTGRAELADFPPGPTPAAPSLALGAAEVSFAGDFSFARKTVTLKSLEISSPLGRGKGAGVFTFAGEPAISSARLELADIPLDRLTALLPDSARLGSYRGRGEIELTLRGAWHNPEVKGLARAGDVEVRGASFRAQKMAVTAPFEWVGSALRVMQARIEASQVTYGDKALWRAASESVEAVANLEYRSAAPLRIDGRVRARGGKFSSPDSSKIGEGLVFGGFTEIVYDPDGKRIGAAGKLSVEAGEILWGKFYGDLRSQKPAADFSLDYSFAADSLQIRRAELSMASIGTLALEGAVERPMQTPDLRLSARSADFLVQGFYRFFLLETFKNQYPLLDRLAVGGRMAFQIELAGPIDRLGVQGELSLDRGELRAKGWHIGPVALRLPFEIAFGKSGDLPARATPLGVLVVEGVRFGQQSLAPIETSVSLSNNQLRLPQPLTADVFGGRVVLSALTWPDVIREPGGVSFSAEMKGLQLDQITQALQWPAFSGTLTGSIPRVHSKANTLRTEGEIDARVFGGRVRIGQLEVENPFSSLASVRLDARITGIELEQLSKTFAFGRISGILEGAIEDLVITNGQPAEMRVDLRSVERRGVEQRISVEALNSITVVSSGQETGALYGGLAGFFDSFRYSKLGFKATLRNDRLTLQGVESTGDKEYLVVGSWLPPTVNIISHTQTIAFSELLRRLERIGSEKPEVQ